MATAVRLSGEKLNAIRTERGWSRAKLARRAGVNEQQIVRWEGGRNTPSADGVAALAAALGIGMADFYERGGGDDDEEDEAEMLRLIEELERLLQFDLAD